MIEIPHIKNLIFQGGSVKGLAYVGAIGALEKLRLDFKNLEKVGGTSAGAITALALALGKTTKDILITAQVNLEEFIDTTTRKKRQIVEFKNQSILTQGSIASELASDLSVNLGLCPGEKMRSWLEGMIKIETNIEYCTFQEFHELVKDNRKNQSETRYRDLYVVGFNLNEQKTITFSWETTPNVIISDAVRISLSIPYLFAPHHSYIKVDKTEQNPDGRTLDPTYANDYWIDGGVTENYPIKIFDGADGNPCKHTLGFSLKRGGANNVPRRLEINNSFDYTKAILSAIMYNTQQRNSLERCCGDAGRTCFIDTLDVGTFDFNLGTEKKNQLIQSGWNAVMSAYQGENYSEELDPCTYKIEEIVEEIEQTENAGKCLIV